MTGFILFRSFLLPLLALLSLFSTISISEAKSSFSFGKNATFKSDGVALYGDAKFVDGGSSIQLNDSVSHGGGRVVYKKPIEFVNTESEYPTGFSTLISFSIPRNRGGRLGFVVFPVNNTFDHSLIEVKFDTPESFTKIGDSNVSVIFNGTTVSEKIQNFTIDNLEEENLLLYAWVDYSLGTHFLEVWLSKSESFNPFASVLFTQIDLPHIDLPRMLKGKNEFMVGVKSYDGNVNLHSWSLETSSFPRDLHSWAVILEQKREHEEEAKRKRRERVWEIVTCFVMTFGSTGLVFFAVMQIWTAFKRNSIVMAMQEDCGMKTKEFEYDKMEAVMTKADAQKGNK